MRTPPQVPGSAGVTPPSSASPTPGTFLNGANSSSSSGAGAAGGGREERGGDHSKTSTRIAAVIFFKGACMHPAFPMCRRLSRLTVGCLGYRLSTSKPRIDHAIDRIRHNIQACLARACWRYRAPLPAWGCRWRCSSLRSSRPSAWEPCSCSCAYLDLRICFLWSIDRWIDRLTSAPHFRHHI